ncbi:4'-phosphopantetheinyl transferase family protein [Clostridium grantii]|uniref:4'-phosphopantetheinyl transferase family protein n=1 Tax=Clostridium grantii TaxID=40575 RepID=UPI001A9A5140|nr:4'-phosphopantetheinyl transferase family protein [Clostridium grantii]
MNRNFFFESFLHDDEKKYFRTLRYERRINSYIIGRFAAKKAVSLLVKEKNFSKINIQNGVFNQPILEYDLFNNLQVSLTHCGQLGAAIVFQEQFLIGIDVENTKSNKNKVLEGILTENEKILIHNTPFEYNEFLVMLWTLKESISKTIKTGLTVPLSIFEIKSIRFMDGYCISSYSNFYQYQSISFLEGNYVFSITYPKKVELNIDIDRIKVKLNEILK